MEPYNCSNYNFQEFYFHCFGTKKIINCHILDIDHTGYHYSCFCNSSSPIPYCESISDNINSYVLISIIIILCFIALCGSFCSTLNILAIKKQRINPSLTNNELPQNNQSNVTNSNLNILVNNFRTIPNSNIPSSNYHGSNYNIYNLKKLLGFKFSNNSRSQAYQV